MTKKIPRNAPCPCGNGKKYKRCHGAGGQEDTENELVLERTSRKMPRSLIIGLAVAVLVLSIALGVTGNRDLAVVSLGIGSMAVLALVVFGNLPPPKGQGDDPGAINFGR